MTIGDRVLTDKQLLDKAEEYQIDLGEIGSELVHATWHNNGEEFRSAGATRREALAAAIEAIEEQSK